MSEKREQQGQNRQGQKWRSIPAYKRIEEDMRAKIRSGEWPADALLPTRPKLAEEYGVALLTLERAIELLLADGTLSAAPGRGTFVASSVPAVSSSSVISTDAPVHSRGEALPGSRPLQQEQAALGHMVAPVLGIITGDLPTPRNVSYNDGNPAFGFDWTSLIIAALERSFSKAGGAIRFIDRYDEEGLAHMSLEKSIRLALEQGANALAIANVVDVTDVTNVVLSSLDIEQVPVVLLSWEALTGPLPYVMYDNVYAGYRAAQHLLQAGYGPLFFLDFLDRWWSKERLRGAQAAVSDARLPASQQLIVLRDEALIERTRQDYPMDYEFANAVGYEVGKTVFTQQAALAHTTGGQRRAAAIIAPTDWMALSLLRAAAEQQLQPGNDFGIIGFDNVPRAASAGLTSLAPPVEEMGKEASRILMLMLQRQSIPHQVTLRSHLIVRSSTLYTHESPCSSPE